MLSPEILTGNLDALKRAQGTCPALAGLGASMRVALSPNHVNIEVKTDAGDWLPIDFSGSHDDDGQWLEGIPAGAKQMILVGVGLGYALERAESLGLARVVALEPDPGVATLFLSRRDWRAWFASGRLRLLTGPDFRGAVETARFLDGLGEIPIVPHPLRMKVEPEASARAATVAAKLSQNAQSNGIARRRFAGPYLLQTITNLPAIAREGNVRALDGAFAHSPAVVVGAGPSLDDNLEDLRAVQDRAVIIAADTSLGPLLSAGIRPHIVVGVDSSELNARHLTTPADTADTMLVTEGSLHPSVFERFAGRLFTFRVADHEPWPSLRATGLERGELRTWGSVLTSAFDLAVRMGCDPIVFAGADLAFTGMRPYCRGTIYDAQWQEWIDKGCSWELLMEDYFSRQPEAYRDDVHGRRTRTAPNLVSFRDWLVERINTLEGRSVINGTGGGILHGPAIRQASLREVFDRLPPLNDVREILRSLREASLESPEVIARVQAFLDEARRSRALRTRWIDFAAGVISEEDILAVVRDAVCDGFEMRT